MSKEDDHLGSKLYEQAEAGRLCLPLLPVCAVEIDGESVKYFNCIKCGLMKPYYGTDENLVVKLFENGYKLCLSGMNKDCTNS